MPVAFPIGANDVIRTLGTMRPMLAIVHFKGGNLDFRYFPGLSCQFAIDDQANALRSVLQFKAIASHILNPAGMTDFPNRLFLIIVGWGCEGMYLTLIYFAVAHVRKMALSRVFRPQRRERPPATKIFMKCRVWVEPDSWSKIARQE